MSMIARQCAFVLVICVLSSCTPAIQSHQSPTENEVNAAIVAAQAARKAGREDEAIANLNRVDATIQQGASSQFCTLDSVQPLLAEHLQLCSYLQAQGNYAAATRVFHSAIALETRTPQWRAEPGPASNAFFGMLSTERADERGNHFKAKARTSVQDHLRRRAIIKKLTESLAEFNQLRNEAMSNYQAGDFSAAARKLERARQVCSASFGASSVELAQVLSLLADVAQIQGQNKECADLRRQVLAIYTLTPRKRSEVLKATSDLAEALDRLRQHSEAEKLHLRALSLLQKNAKWDETVVLGRAARNLILQGRVDDGARMEREFRKAALNLPRTESVTAFQIEFGRFYEVNKRFGDAIVCFELALKDPARVSPEVATMISLTLFKCKLETGDLAGCDALAKQLQKATRTDKLALAGLLNLLALRLKSINVARAIELNRAAVKLCEQSKGVNSSEAISSLVQLSDRLLDAGDRNSSSATLREAANRCKISTDKTGVAYFRQEIELRLGSASKSTAAQAKHGPDRGVSP